MYVCYVDEAGCTGVLPSATSPIQPAFIIVGVALPLRAVGPLTRDFLRLKRTFYPAATAAFGRALDVVRFEIKGADVRRDAAEGTSSEQRHAIGLLDKVLALTQAYHAKIFGRIWIKGIGVPLDGTAIYTYSVQDICRTFQHLLEAKDDYGIVIADSRNKGKNTSVSHSIFTQRYSAAGDPYNRIVEMPTFGHSDNHVGLQVADLLCSGFLFPLAMHAYCAGHVTSVHVRAGYGALAPRFGLAIRHLQYRYQDDSGRWRGGLTVTDQIAQRPGGLLFS